MNKTTDPQAFWIWHPGDFELWLSAKVQIRRSERGMFCPPCWRLDRPAQIVTFEKRVELPADETVEFRVDGQFSMLVDGRPVYDANREIRLPKGSHHLFFRVYNADTPPAIWVRGNTVVSDKSWAASKQSGRPVQADAWIFDTPEHRPSTYKLDTKAQAAARIDRNSQSALVDFGRETFGYLKFHNLKGNGTLTARYGESAEEAHAGELAETWDNFAVAQPAAADFIADNSRAFRYVLLTWQGEISFDEVSMLYEYLPVEHKGSFHCADDEINRIWDVAARTLHLSAREFFLDGIKRDRWIWSGDAYQSYLMGYYLFFDNPLVKRTTWALRGNDPVEQHLNTILDYSFYWFMGICDYYQYTGDLDFVRQIYPKMLTLMEFCLGRRNAGGMVEGRPDDWVFIDWAPMDKAGEISFEQLLLCRSLETVALCGDLLGEPEQARKYRALADKLREEIMTVFWDPQQGALIHNRVAGKPSRSITKYANMFALIFGYLNEQQTADIKRNVLLNDQVQKITTPYMRFYELEALCKINRQAHVLQEIKDYWGGMLRLGATSFWETYDPAQSGAEHYAMYDRPFGKSLCHAWGAGPIYLLGKYFLGVSPASPGYETYLVEPELGGLEWMEGSVPTPSGNIKLTVGARQINITTVGGQGTLKFHSSRQPSCPNGEIKTLSPDHYEMALSPHSQYQIDYRL
jgi:hypothetical protein